MNSSLAVALRVRASMEQKPIKLRKPPPARWPHKQRLDYYKDLLAMVQGVQLVVRRMVLPELARIVAATNITRPEETPIRHDAPGDEIEALFDAVAEEAEAVVPDRMITSAASKMALSVATWNGNELQRHVQQVAKINVWGDTTGLAEHLELTVNDNVKLVKGLVHGQLDDLKGIVVRGARAGVHQSVIAEQIEQRFAMPKKRAALIANDQVGKLNGELNQIRQQRLGVRRYRWSSSQDERVRKRHRQLNGTIQEWAKPPVTDERTGERAHPGQPIRCRCQPIPIVDDVLADLGLIGPEDVEVGMPKPGRRAVPQVPPGLPQPPPANVPPPVGTRKRNRGRGASGTGVEPTMQQPPAPKSASSGTTPLGTPTLPQVPPANSPPAGGGGGSAGGGGGGRGGPPGGRPPGPPSEPERKRLEDDLRAGMGALPAKGGHAPKVRGSTQALVGLYGLTPRANQTRLAELHVDSLYGKAVAMLFGDGRVKLEPELVASIRSGLTKLKRGATMSELEADAISTLIHEELHAAGPDVTAYYDAGSLVEEVATETLSRGMARDLIGKKGIRRVHANHPLALPKKALDSRPYDEAIFGVLTDIRRVTDADAAAAHDLLRQASLAFKASSGELATPSAAAARFAEGVPGLSARKRADLAALLVKRGARKQVVGAR